MGMGMNMPFVATISLSLLLIFPSMATSMTYPHDPSVVGYSPNDLLSDRGISNLFESWVGKHGRNYTSAGEKSHRFGIFKENLKKIDERNKVISSYCLGLNKFADMSDDEFKNKYLGGLMKVDRSTKRKQRSYNIGLKGETLPSTVDWRNGAAVTPVKDQSLHFCGACWAFSAVAAVEGINAIVTGKLISLSEQQIIDCDASNLGCLGGKDIVSAFGYIIKNGGVSSEHAYPYLGFGSNCRPKKSIVTIDGYAEVDAEADETNFLRSLAQQPLSVGINSTNLQFYTKGVINAEYCSPKLDHAVTAVGYGTTSVGRKRGHDYFIMKNSWGKDWGENGFFRIARNTGNAYGVCGINTLVSYPIKNQ